MLPLVLSLIGLNLLPVKSLTLRIRPGRDPWSSMIAKLKPYLDKYNPCCFVVDKSPEQSRSVQVLPQQVDYCEMDVLLCEKKQHNHSLSEDQGARNIKFNLFKWEGDYNNFVTRL